MSPDRVRQAAMGTATFVVVLGMVALSRAPWRAHPDETALLRLSLTARPERIESCRRLSAEELAALPAHMRQEVVCEGRTARYRLEVDVAGARVADDLLAGGGARSDRPIHLLREHDVGPGEHRLVVRLTRAEDPDVTTEEVEGRRRVETVPPELVLDTVVRFGPRAVVLVGYDPRERRLTLATP